MVQNIFVTTTCTYMQEMMYNQFLYENQHTQETVELK